MSYVKEPNIMQHYFGEQTAVYTLMEMAREGFLRGQKINPPEGLLRRAQRDFSTKREALDQSTYSFQQDLFNFVYHRDKQRTRREHGPHVVMVMQGRLMSERDGAKEEQIIPAYLGQDPHVFFTGDPTDGTTIDTMVTREQGGRALRENPEYGPFMDNGFSFHARKSLFFYVPHQEFRRIADDKEPSQWLVDMTSMLYPTKGSVGFHSCERPTLEEFVDTGLTHTSYRLKQTATEKILKKLQRPEGGITSGRREDGTYFETGILSDLVAHRVVVKDMDEARELERLLTLGTRRDPIEIGNRRNGTGTSVSHIYTRDRFADADNDAFKAIKLVVQTKTRGFEPAVREVQIVPLEQHYMNEFVPGRTDHNQQKKRQSHVPKRYHELIEHYREIIDSVCKESSPLVEDGAVIIPFNSQ